MIHSKAGSIGDYAYHLFTDKEIAIDEDGYNNAYPLDIKLDNKKNKIGWDL